MVPGTGFSALRDSQGGSPGRGCPAAGNLAQQGYAGHHAVYGEPFRSAHRSLPAGSRRQIGDHPADELLSLRPATGGIPPGG